MSKLKTLADKQAIRYRMVYAALATLIVIPVAALLLLYVGIDASSTEGLFSISSATLGAIVIGHFSTSIKDDGSSRLKDTSND